MPLLTFLRSSSNTHAYSATHSNMRRLCRGLAMASTLLPLALLQAATAWGYGSYGSYSPGELTGRYSLEASRLY